MQSPDRHHEQLTSPCILSNLIVFIIFCFYADNMHLRYMLFSGGLYSGIKLMEMAFKVVMLPVIASYLAFLNNTCKVKKCCADEKGFSYLQSAIRVWQEGASWVCKHIYDLSWIWKPGYPKVCQLHCCCLLACINSLAQQWLAFQAVGATCQNLCAWELLGADYVCRRMKEMGTCSRWL